MYKRHVCFCLILISAICFKSYAQIKAGKITQPDGGTITTTGPVNDGQLNETWKSEYKSKDGTVTRRITYKKDLEGKWTSSSEELTPSGRVTETMDADLDVANGRFRIEKFTIRWFNKRTGKVTQQVTGEIDHVTALIKMTDSITQIVREMPIDEMNKMNQDYLYPFIHANETTVSQNPTGNPVDPGSGSVNDICARQFILGFGPSYLIRDFGDDKESMWGVNLVFNYHLTQSISAGIDLSTYSKKISDEKFSTSFYLLDAEYLFGKKENTCTRPVSIFARIAVGMMHERFADQKESGMAYGAGAGTDIRFSNSFHGRIGFDYIVGKLGDENSNSFRIGVLATYNKTKK